MLSIAHDHGDYDYLFRNLLPKIIFLKALRKSGLKDKTSLLLTIKSLHKMCQLIDALN